MKEVVQNLVTVLVIVSTTGLVAESDVGSHVVVMFGMTSTVFLPLRTISHYCLIVCLQCVNGPFLTYTKGLRCAGVLAILFGKH